MTYKNIDEFGDELAKVRMDSQLKWAEVDDAEVMTREEAFDDVKPSDGSARDEGIEITFSLASERTVSVWYRKPHNWSPMKDLVLLLHYWELDPGDIDRLTDDDRTFEVPMSYDDSEEAFRLDWQTIEQTVHTQQLEEDDA